ncbi:MAG: CRISPR-associated protein Cas5 [Nitrosopumilus sp.]
MVRKSEKCLVIEAVSQTASFRIPEFHNYHKTLPLPPATTVVGLVGAVLGLSYQDAQQFFSDNFIKIGIYGKSGGFFKDIWKALSSKAGTRDTIIRKEYHFQNQYVFVFISDEYTIYSLQKAFRNPVYPTVIGSSDSLLKIINVDLLKDFVIVDTHRVQNCILLGDQTNHVKIDLDDLEYGKTYRYTRLNAPQVYNLPNAFVFEKYGVRKIKEKKEVTFIGMPVKSELAIPSLKYTDKVIPVFEHVP